MLYLFHAGNPKNLQSANIIPQCYYYLQHASESCPVGVNTFWVLLSPLLFSLNFFNNLTMYI